MYYTLSVIVLIAVSYPLPVSVPIPSPLCLPRLKTSCLTPWLWSKSNKHLEFKKALETSEHMSHGP